MNDSEIRQSLITICEMLKMEFKYLSAIQHGVATFFRAACEELPMLEGRYKEQWGQFGEYPGSAELLQRVDALLAQLKKG
jgi:hypothetical protein